MKNFLCFSIFLIGLLFSITANANSAVPGTLIWFSSSIVSESLGWIAICMCLCILVEWAVYRYSKQYARPLLASLISNTVSLIAGIPLTLLAVIDPAWFILPTIISIVVEYWTIVSIRRYVLAKGIEKVSVAPVLWGNVLSNVMMLCLVYLSYLKLKYDILLFW